MPAMNAPNTASSPRAWVAAPEASATSSTAVRCAARPSARTRTRRSSASTPRWPSVNAKPRKSDEPGDRDRELRRVERARLREARDDAEQDPARDVVDHRRGDHHLRDVAAHQVEVGEDLRDHGQRGDAERGAHEQREDARSVAAADEDVGQREAEADAREHRAAEAPERDARRGAAEAADQRQVGLEPGDHESRNTPIHADPASSARCSGSAGKSHSCARARDRRARSARAPGPPRARRSPRAARSRAAAPPSARAVKQQREQLEPEEQELVFGGHRGPYASFARCESGSDAREFRPSDEEDGTSRARGDPRHDRRCSWCGDYGVWMASSHCFAEDAC